LFSCLFILFDFDIFTWYLKALATRFEASSGPFHRSRWHMIQPGKQLQGVQVLGLLMKKLFRFWDDSATLAEVQSTLKYKCRANDPGVALFKLCLARRSQNQPALGSIID
jgi:hypothetical protein